MIPNDPRSKTFRSEKNIKTNFKPSMNLQASQKIRATFNVSFISLKQSHKLKANIRLYRVQNQTTQKHSLKKEAKDQIHF